MIRARKIAEDLHLNMKIGDVEYQGDGNKAIFYYIADERVDFRELIKIFAEQFRIRIEMKQIGARQEAGRIGGLGSCGRELCCASWISSFVSVTTNAARHQEISLNPQKLAGQCGKLKCCLIYELDTYLDARKDFPRVREPLQVLDGEYYLVKTDILSRTMWFSSDPHAVGGMQPLSVDRVKEIIHLNRQGIKPDRLNDVDLSAKSPELTFSDGIGEDSLTRFDKQKRRRGGRDRKRSDNDTRNSRNETNRDKRSAEPQAKAAEGNEQRNNTAEKNNTPRREGDNRSRNNRRRGGNRPERSQNERNNTTENRNGSNNGGGNSGGNSNNGGEQPKERTARPQRPNRPEGEESARNDAPRRRNRNRNRQ